MSVKPLRAPVFVPPKASTRSRWPSRWPHKRSEASGRRRPSPKCLGGQGAAPQGTVQAWAPGDLAPHLCLARKPLQIGSRSWTGPSCSKSISNINRHWSQYARKNNWLVFYPPGRLTRRRAATVIPESPRLTGLLSANVRRAFYLLKKQVLCWERGPSGGPCCLTGPVSRERSTFFEPVH